VPTAYDFAPATLRLGFIHLAGRYVYLSILIYAIDIVVRLCAISMYSQFRLNGDMCLQPMILRLPHFDSVSFISPDGTYIYLSILLRAIYMYIYIYICVLYICSSLD